MNDLVRAGAWGVATSRPNRCAGRSAARPAGAPALPPTRLPRSATPAGLWEEAGVPSAGRADYECLRCGGKVASPQESRYCPKCERYLGLTD